MRKTSFLLALALAGMIARAAMGDEGFARSLTEIGGSLTIGDGSSAANVGYGGCFRTLQYFDHSKASGCYYGLFLSAFVHRVGDVEIGDTRLFHLGWRSPILFGAFGFDACVAPVLGSRIVGDVVLGEMYAGVSPALGVFFRINSVLDVKLAFEPVVNLFGFGGSDASNLSYSDISLYLVVKSHYRRVRLDWGQ